jgi:hypothetical protein
MTVQVVKSAGFIRVQPAQALHPKGPWQDGCEMGLKGRGLSGEIACAAFHLVYHRVRRTILSHGCDMSVSSGAAREKTEKQDCPT